MKKNILVIIGSLRQQSLNGQLARRAVELLGDRAQVTILNYADLPFMNQDIEFPPPEQVQRVRQEVQNADGIWFFTPEYNSSYPGVLKNLLDWLSRPLVKGDFSKGTAIAGKKVAISAAGGGAAAAGSRQKLRELLKFIKVNVLEQELGISVGGAAFQTSVLTLTPEHENQLAEQADAFLQFLNE